MLKDLSSTKQVAKKKYIYSMYKIMKTLNKMRTKKLNALKNNKTVEFAYAKNNKKKAENKNKKKMNND